MIKNNCSLQLFPLLNIDNSDGLMFTGALFETPGVVGFCEGVFWTD